MFPKGSAPFRDEFAFGRPLLEALAEHPSEIAKAYQAALEKAISAWAKNQASDDQALFLDQAIRVGLLSNSPEELPEIAALMERYREIEEKQIPVPVRVPGVLEPRAPFDQALMVRGNPKQAAEPVARTFLDAIDSTPYSANESGRLQLAQDLFRSDNPLSRRVSVNRFWHHAFGEGLVRTPDNLGRLGQKPSHPELLDYLAVRFQENGYSIKSLLRLLVTSETWQASSEASKEALAKDPDNLLLSHAHLRRLDAEAIRDSLLAVSGQLENGGEGPPVTGDRPKRSVYVRVKRNSLDSFLGTFDAPVPASTTGRRDVTNVPGQSLTLLNDPFILKAAREWTAQLKGKDADNVDAMFLGGLGRQPTDQERTDSISYVKSSMREKVQADQERTHLKKRLGQAEAEILSFEKDAKERVLATRGPNEGEGPLPFAAWDFETDFKDQVGSLHGKVHGSARLENGALILDGKGHVSTAELSKDLRAKTLVARVKLSTLDQRGGGVVSAESGAIFDSIVYGEQAPRQWLAGSNVFARTEPFRGTPESAAATNGFVHLAIVYHEDGRIQGYREGKPYGRSYKKGGVHTFGAGQSHVLFGLRHGAPSGDRLLRGRIDEAAVFDRALSAEEVAALASGSGNYVSTKDLLAAMTANERQRYGHAKTTESKLRDELKAMDAMPSPPSGWADLAHAIFNLKEFIYLR